MLIGARPSAESARRGLGFRASTAAGSFLLLALFGAFVTTTAKPNAMKNGIRLVGDTDGGAKGRLEIFSNRTNLKGSRKSDSKGLWFPVCSQEDEDTAQRLCEVMGYKYGRWYYNAAVASPLKSKYKYSAASLKCLPKEYFTDRPGGRRRHLHSTADTTAAAAAGLAAASHTNDDNSAAAAISAATAAAVERHSRLLAAEGDTAAAAAAEKELVIISSSAAVATPHHRDTQQQQHRARERSLAYKTYVTSFPQRSPYQCEFYLGNCHPNGPFGGIECSSKPLPTAPPRPPSPPSPPSAQYYEELIRVVGGKGPLTGTVEPNLCAAAPEAFCNAYLPYGRVELLVDPPGGGGGGEKIWAPLCGGAAALRQADAIARIACQMEYGWPNLQLTPGTMIGSRVPTSAPYFFTVPSGPAPGAKDFNPAAYQGWATITAVPDAEPTTLQAGNLTVSATPCNSLFALICDTLFAGRRR